MKKTFYIIFILSILLEGCLPSVIKLEVKPDPNPYTMFGKVPSRDFYIPITIGDSLKEKWEKDINGGLTNSSVTLYNSYVFINDLSGWVTCLDLNTGKQLGQLKDKGSIFSSPIIENNILIYPISLNNENYSLLNFYNFRSGEPVFAIKIQDKILSELIHTKDGIILNTLGGKVIKYNFNGSRVWEADTKASTHTSLAMKDNIIIFGNDKGEIVALNAYNGNQIFKKKIGYIFTNNVSISDSTAFLGDKNGAFFAVKIRTGNIKWKIDTGSEIISTPVFNDEIVFIGNLGGKLFAVNKASGKIIWQSELNGVINATPLLAKNYLIVPNLDGELDFVEPATGKIKKRFILPAHVRLSPLYFKNTLFIGYDNGILGAYEIVE
ncbi:MAG: PQQ-binding-like beta-propeller repeat protein [Bacteroidetes bacterium]|nr:PQQ-binding-like beta-propeller repeat protein [Bacteroidota bacterium]